MAEQPPKMRDRSLPADAAGDNTAAEHTADSFLIDDEDRYSRLRLISWWRQERLRDARVPGRRRVRLGGTKS